MLQVMRDMSKSWIFKSLMILLVISFGIWGVGDAFRTHPGQRIVASVGKIDIPVQSLDFHFQFVLPEARKVFGPEITPSQAKQLGFLERTLEMIIEDHSFYQDASRLGLQLDDVFLLRQIAATPQMQDANGHFDQAKWNQLLAHNGLTEQFFIDQKKRDLLRKTILQSVIAGVRPPKVMIDTLYQVLGAKRLLEVVSLRNNSLSVPKPSDTDLKQYYEAHEDAFAAPEYRGVTIAQLETKDLGKDISVSDEEIQKAYDSRGDELAEPESRDLSQIVFQSEEKAKAFHDSLKDMSDFSSAAKAKGMTPVFLDRVEERTILPALYTSVFALNEGETTNPIQTELGWHIVQVKKIYKGGKPPLDKIKAALRLKLQEERLGDILAHTVNQIDDNLAAGKSLEDIADSLRLRLSRFPAIDAAGNDEKGKQLTELPHKNEVVQQAFGLGEGETGQVLDDRKGNYFVVRTDQIKPTHTRPFSEVKTIVSENWLIEQQTLAAAKEAQNIAAALKKGEKATRFASQSGVDVRLSKPLSQLGDMDKDLPSTALPQVFKMKKGDVITAATTDQHYILRLVDILPVNMKKPDASRLKVVDGLKEELPLNYVEAYARYLQKDFPRHIDKELLESLKN